MFINLRLLMIIVLLGSCSAKSITDCEPNGISVCYKPCDDNNICKETNIEIKSLNLVEIREYKNNIFIDDEGNRYYRKAIKRISGDVSFKFYKANNEEVEVVLKNGKFFLVQP